MNNKKIKKIDLLTTVESGGCSAKLPAAELDAILCDLPALQNPNLLVGNESKDDAAVYKISEDKALVTTTDFFPPVCSDPYDFGCIAAANALSDIYAMGGIPLTALNIAMFPSASLDLSILKEILQGGAETIIKAGAVLCGGHTIDDNPIKYGLAVTGMVHPKRMITNSSSKPGDILILTKPLGTGVIIGGKRIDEVSEDDYMTAVDIMKNLNREASEAMIHHKIKSATDITGFSLLGHGKEMAEGSSVQLVINSKNVPALPGSMDLLDLGGIPGACFRNMKQVEADVKFESNVIYERKMLLADAQTSGGLLISCPESEAESLLEELKICAPGSAVIGKVKKLDKGNTPILVI